LIRIFKDWSFKDYSLDDRVILLLSLWAF